MAAAHGGADESERDAAGDERYPAHQPAEWEADEWAAVGEAAESVAEEALMPFLSQAALNALQGHLDHARADLKDSRTEVREARAEIARLTDTIVGMKRANYHPPDVQGGPPPTMVPPSPVELAIRAHIPRHLRGQVYSEVASWRLRGMTDEQIVKRIELGEEGYSAA